MNVWKKCLGILYPQTCCFCGKVSSQSICEDCAEKVEYVKEPRCKQCGKPIRYAETEKCSDCMSREFPYDSGRSIWIHKGVVRDSIYRFKYGNRRCYGEFYAEEMYRLYRETITRWGVDVIIPIPLHRRRKRKRGYNQSEVVARHLSRLTHIPVDTKSVKRRKYTKPQKSLRPAERRKNLQRAFEVTDPWKQPKCVLLIDDIYTTGSTIDSVASLLKAKGAQKVFFLTISIGQGF